MQKTIAFTIAIALTANAQRIETEKLDRHKVIRVETAPNHLSVIELAEPITEVAARSSSYRDRMARQQGIRTASRSGSHDQPVCLDGLRSFEP
jgi:hypothetical protein